MRHPLWALLCALLLSVILMAFALWLYDPESGFVSALMEVLPSFLGEIGGGDDGFASVIILLGLLASVGVLAIVTALIVNRFVQFCERGGIIVNNVRLRQHIVICGWNSQGELIVDDLLSANPEMRGRIVILADIARRPIDDDRVVFLQGNPTNDADLRRASMEEASSAIILTDFTADPNEADGKALLIVLAVETLNPAVHTCAQIMNSENRDHFLRANTDEIICLEQLGGYLAVSSALNYGMSQVVSELLAFNEGSEFYRYDDPLPDALSGKTFAEAVRILGERQIIPIGVETVRTEEEMADLEGGRWDVRQGEGEFLKRCFAVNPPSTYRLRRNDTLFIIAEERPEEL